MQKGIIAALALAALLLTAAPAYALEVMVNDAKVEFDVPPRLENGRVLVPVRFVAERLGATVTYSPSSRSVTIF